MKISLFGSLCAMACTLAMSSASFATSDLSCSLSQSAQEASDTIAALLSRGYLAAGHSYVDAGNGVGTMDLGAKVILTRTQQNGQETFSIAMKNNANGDDKKVLAALLKVSGIADQTLSADDQAALTECDHLLAQYVGVSPQPDPPIHN